jgi:hypothetical protein
VEIAARRLTEKWYRARGWRVRPRPLNAPGYDLLCIRNGTEEHVEVKGVTGEVESFPITEREVRQAREDPKFFLCAVTLALSVRPRLSRRSGAEFLKEFTLQPLSYMATFRRERQRER